MIVLLCNHEILIKDILNTIMTHRVAVLDKDLCQPKKCGLECIKYCPINKSGADCIVPVSYTHLTLPTILLV